MSEPWLEEERRQKRWDDWLETRLCCARCGSPILRGRYLPLPGGALCGSCLEGMLEYAEAG